MTRVGTSTDPIHSTDANSPPHSPRSEGRGALRPPGGGAPAPRRSLSAPLDALRTLNSAGPGRRPAGAASPRSALPPAPPPPPHAAQPDAGYWTRLLEGEEVDLRELFVDEPAAAHAAPPPATDAPQGQPAASPHVAGTTRPPAGTISSEDLLAIARLAQHLSIARAAQECNISDSLIYQFLGMHGLTDRGLQAAGDNAGEINRLMGLRHRSVSLRTRRDIDGDGLLAVANSARTSSLRAAAREHGIEDAIFGYMSAEGLTELGRATAGPLADEIDRIMATRISRAPLPPTMTAEFLQSVVEAARDRPLQVAARTLGRTLQQIDAYVAPWGLTHAGRYVAGERADALDEMLYQRYLACGGAGAIADGVTFPAISPPAMRRQHNGAVNFLAPHPRRKVTPQMLAAVAQAATSEGSITRASEACGVNGGTISTYLSLRGLTVDGHAAAGNLAARIQHYMQMFVKRHSVTPHRPRNSRADEQMASRSPMPARGVPQLRVPRPAAPDPAPHAGVQPAATPPLAPPRQARAPVNVEQGLPPLGGERTSIDAIDLVAIARLSVTMSIPDAAARLNLPEASVSPFLSMFGLTPRGRALAGDYAAEIDRFTASRLEHLSTVASELQAQGRSFASFQDDPFVRELMRMVGGMPGVGADTPPTSSEPPVAASTHTLTALESEQPQHPEQSEQLQEPEQLQQPAQPQEPEQPQEPRQLEQLEQPEQPGQPAQPEQSRLPRSRGKKRQRVGEDVGRSTRRRRAAAVSARPVSTKTTRKPRAASTLARSRAMAQRGTTEGHTADDIEKLPAPRRTKKMTGSVLLRVAEAVARSTPIKHAAIAEGSSIVNLRRYLHRNGLTPKGKRLAGPLAEEIDRLMRKTAERPSTRKARGAGTSGGDAPASSSPALLNDVTVETEDEFDEVMRLLDEQSGGVPPASTRESASPLSNESGRETEDPFDEVMRLLEDDEFSGEPPGTQTESASRLLNESAVAIENRFEAPRQLLEDDLASHGLRPDGGADVTETVEGANGMGADIDNMVAELTDEASLPLVADVDDAMLPASDAVIQPPGEDILDSIDFSILDLPGALNEWSILNSLPTGDPGGVPVDAMEEMVAHPATEAPDMPSGVAALANEPMRSPPMSVQDAMFDTPTVLFETEERMHRLAESPLSHLTFTPEEPFWADPTPPDEQDRAGTEQPPAQPPRGPQ